ncbi:MAG: hypothetical protein ACREMO_12665 [Gemmatimonadales bacterium]
MLEEADALVAEASRQGLPLQVGHLERFNRALRGAEAFLDGPRFMEDVVERLPLAVPEGDALRLELRSFVHAVLGERETVVTGEEGRATLALALQVVEAVNRSTPSLLRER